MLRHATGRDVRIKKLICLDTVGALGIPRTGVFGLVNILQPFIQKYEFMETDAASSQRLAPFPPFTISP